MIVDLLVTVLFGLLNAVLDLIPTFAVFGLPGVQGDMAYSQHGLAVQLRGLLSIWNLFFPIDTLFIGLVAIMGSRVFVALVHFVQWIWGLLPFKST